jgi:hypothetical protein
MRYVCWWRHGVAALVCGAIAAAGLTARGRAQTSAWPLADAPHLIEITKASGLEDPGGLPDPDWIHLHRGHHSAPDALQATLKVRLLQNANYYSEIPFASSGLARARVLVRAAPVTAWVPIDQIDGVTVHVDAPGFDAVPDGVHDLSIEVDGAARRDYKPAPIFIHVTKGRPVSPLVPILSDYARAGPHATYVSAADRRFRGYPMDPRAEAWSAPPHQADLFLERLMPNAEWEKGLQMWWDELPHQLPFVRELAAKYSNDDHRELRVQGKQERMPFKDGPRGVGWIGNLITGQVDSQGRFAFAESGGRVGYLMPDGEVVTVAGWRVAPGKDPVWITKSMAQIRGNQELRGRWIDGQYPGEAGGFRTPLDVAVDPRDESIWYVASFEDHCIWKVVVDPATRVGTVSVFAGDPGHRAGAMDGAGHAARFEGPTSVVFDPIADVLYVADQGNHAIRRITRAGVVSTVAGRPGMEAWLSSRGVSDVYDQVQTRAASRIEVTAAEAARGVRPDIYVPQTVRVDSRGRLVILELGFGLIRRIDPVTGETVRLGFVDNKFQRFAFGWAWLDVDRWGTAGPKDGIYWCKSVGGGVDGDPGQDRFNEVYAWLAPDGGASRFIFGDDWEPYPNGWGRNSETGPPHYPWLVAVDPRGAVLIAGIGEHGVSRLRARRVDDPVPGRYDPDYYQGEQDWNRGGVSGAVASFALKHGWDGHSLLGFADAWGLRGDETDQQVFDHFNAPAELRGDPVAGPRWAEYVRLNARSGTGGRVAQADPVAVGVSQATFRPGEVMVATVRATAGAVAQPVDAYVVVQTPDGAFLSLMGDGRLLPGVAPIARSVVIPTIALPFAFPIPAGVPPGLYRWITAVTSPGTLSFLWPLVFSPFAISP